MMSYTHMSFTPYRLLRHFSRRRQRGDRGQSFLKSLPGADDDQLNHVFFNSVRIPCAANLGARSASATVRVGF